MAKTPPSPEVISAGMAFLYDCPINFEFDVAWVPSARVEMVENPETLDESFIGIVIYEDDIMRYVEHDRAKIGKSLYEARNFFRISGFRCEFLPVSGRREDHSLDSGVPIL